MVRRGAGAAAMNAAEEPGVGTSGLDARAAVAHDPSEHETERGRQ